MTKTVAYDGNGTRQERTEIVIRWTCAVPLDAILFCSVIRHMEDVRSLDESRNHIMDNKARPHLVMYTTPKFGGKGGISKSACQPLYSRSADMVGAINKTACPHRKSPAQWSNRRSTGGRGSPF